MECHGLALGGMLPRPGFVGLFGLCDVVGAAARIDELALLPEHVGIDQDMLDRAILTDHPRLEALERFAAV